MESKYIFYASLLIVLALVLWWAVDWYNFYQHIKTGRNLAAQAQKYERLNKKGETSVLFIGDSTVVGTGTTNNIYSTSGRLGTDFPEFSITNRGVNGALISDLEAQLDAVENQNFDIIVIQAGGNDVVYFTDWKSFESSLASVLQKARKKSDKVIMMSSGDVGASPIWPAGVGWIFTSRTHKAREILLETTVANDVPFIDLLTNGVNAEFGTYPQKYHAADRFHPSDEGYRLWYDALQLNLKRLKWL